MICADNFKEEGGSFSLINRFEKSLVIYRCNSYKNRNSYVADLRTKSSIQKYYINITIFYIILYITNFPK